MVTRLLIIFISVSLLSACLDLGGGSNDKNNLPVIGSWETTVNGNTSYLFITSSRSTFYLYIEPLECYSTFDSEISDLNSENFEVNGNAVPYSINNNQLVFTDGTNTTYNTSTFSSLEESNLISCENPEATGNIEIVIEFNELPETILINNEGHDYEDDDGAYGINLIFDIDNSGDFSNDDMELSIERSFNEGKNNEQVPFTDLYTAIFYAYGEEILGNNISSIYSASIAMPDLISNASSNTLTFSIAKSKNKALATILANGDFQLTTTYTDINDDTQSDRYPSFGYTAYASGVAMTDETGDVFGNYSTDTIIDIKSVTITVTE